jgi:hypothetical protein
MAEETITPWKQLNVTLWEWLVTVHRHTTFSLPDNYKPSGRRRFVLIDIRE